MKNQVLTEYLSYLKSIRNLTPATLDAYERDLRGFFDWLDQDEEVPITHIDLSVIRAWVAQSSRKGLNPRSINRQISALKGFFAWQIKRGILENSPLDGLRSLKTRHQLPQWLFEAEMSQVLDQGPGLIQAAVDPTQRFIQTRDQAVVETLYASGCRVSELAGMTLARLDLQRQRVLVQGKGRKERFVFLGQPASAALEAYLQVRQEAFPCPRNAREPVFLNAQGRGLSVRSIQNIVARRQAMSGLQKRVSPHGFRHSFASHILDRGADIRVVQELLGHASLSTTQIYTHTSLGRLKELHAQAHPHGQRRSPAALPSTKRIQP